ncbi:MAG: hypothetical protein ACXVEF_06985 [Polyangiales bacterium]
MIRKLSAVMMIVSATACAAQSKPSMAPASAPAGPSGGEPAATPSGEAAPATAPQSGATGTSTVEEQPTVPAPPPATAAPPTAGATPSTKSPATAPKPSPTPPPGTDKAGGGGKPNSVGAAQASFDEARKSFVAAADCIHMCKALASMTNATTHLCELTQGGSEQKRCTDAKAKLAAADAKVKSSCGGCSE